jgi:hypothetical protein
MDAGGKRGAQAALAVNTASMKGARTPQLPMNLGAIGESAIGEFSETTRKRVRIQAQPLLTVNLDEVITSAKAEYGAAPLKAIGLIADTFNLAFGQVSRQHTRTLQAVEGLLLVQDEELQMLWWLMGQRSISLDCAFRDIPEFARPIVFASELSGITASMPGPLSVKAILSRTGLTDREEIPLSKVINAADDQWLQKSVPERDLSFVTTPIHFGIKRRMETGAGSDWIAGWAAAAGIAGDLKMTSLAIALQFYREQLLLVFGEM